jgi:molybdate transport system regulatory protein
MAMEPKLRLWVAFGDRTKFGDGRARLLELIDRHGSINRAVAEVGMSYRAAWGYIQELEAAAGFVFLDRRPGGGGRGGAHLTPEGRAFVERYWTLRRELDKVMARRFASVFRGGPGSRKSRTRSTPARGARTAHGAVTSRPRRA